MDATARRTYTSLIPSASNLLATPPRNLSVLMDRFLEWFDLRVRAGARSAHTATMHRCNAEWLRAVLGDELELGALTGALLEQVAGEASARGGAGGRPLNVRTVAKRFCSLRAAMTLGERRGWCTRPVFPSFATGASSPRERIFQSVDDYERVCAVLPVHRREWLAVAFFTGQHASDVERMTWADVQLFSAPPVIVIRNTKNRRPIRRVQCPAPLVSTLVARLERLHRTGTTPSEGDPLVQPWPTRGYQLGRACVRLGMQPMNAIDLRHSCATILAAEGVTKGTADYLGHSTTTMVERVYAHALPASLKAQTRALERWARRRRKPKEARTSNP